MNLLTPLLARLFCYFRKHCLANLLEMTSSVSSCGNKVLSLEICKTCFTSIEDFGCFSCFLFLLHFFFFFCVFLASL